MVLVILVANFFAGAFLCNGVPHFVSGVTGHAFPTPFARPPGVGLSPPVVNVVWGFANVVVGALLLSYWPVGWRIGPSLLLFLFGVLVMGLFLAIHFGRVMRARGSVTVSLLDDLRALEAELHHPGVRSSRARLEQLLHPAFHEVGRSGRAYTREMVIGFLETDGAPPTIDSSDYVVHALAADCALLTYRSTRTTDGVTLRSSIWLKTITGWQLFYHQGTAAA